MPKVGLLGGYNALRSYGDPLASKKNWVVSGTSSTMIAAAPNGNIYTVQMLSSSAAIYCFDSTGHLLWSKLTTNYFSSSLIGIVVDSTSALYICGGDTSANTYLLKMDSTGAAVWARSLANNVAYTLTIDTSDNIYISGYVYSPYTRAIYSFNSSGTTLAKTSIFNVSERTLSYYNNALYSVFVSNLTKFTTSGTVIWNYTLSNVPGIGFAISECYVNPYNGDIWVTGYTTISSVTRLVVMKIIETGGVPSIAFQVVTDQGANSPSVGLSTSGKTITFDSNGDVYVGHIVGILKYNSSNTLVWQRGIGGVGGSNTALAVQANGFLFNGYGGTYFVGSLPKDGSKTGGYTVGPNTFNYSATSYTFSVTSMTLSSGTTPNYTTNNTVISSVSNTSSSFAVTIYRLAI